MEKMTEIISLSEKEMHLINDLFSLTPNEIYQKYGYKRNDTIVHKAKFPDNIEVDIKLVICEDDKPYAEGVLFKNGSELVHTEPDDTYYGEWTFECAGKQYVVDVIVE